MNIVSKDFTELDKKIADEFSKLESNKIDVHQYRKIIAEFITIHYSYLRNFTRSRFNNYKLKDDNYYLHLYEDCLHDFLVTILDSSDKHIIKYHSILIDNNLLNYFLKALYYLTTSTNSTFIRKELRNKHTVFSTITSIDEIIEDNSLRESEVLIVQDQIKSNYDLVVEHLLNENESVQYGIEWYEARIFKDYIFNSKMTFKELSKKYNLSSTMIYYQYQQTRKKIINNLNKIKQ